MGSVEHNASSDEIAKSTEHGAKASFAQRIKKRLGKNSVSQSDSSEPKAKPIPFRQLFAYATRPEAWRLAVSCIAATVHGTLLPLFTIIFGSIIDKFLLLNDPSGDGIARDDISREIGVTAKWFLILGAVAFVTSFVQVRFSLIFAQRVGSRLRSLYFNSLMRQDASWYDQNDGGELTARVAGDVSLVQAGIGEKLASTVQFTVMFITGFIIAFVYGWKLTLVILAIAPLLAIAGALFGKLSAESTSTSQGAYGAAGAIASEVISLIKTVTAYNGQESEAQRYEKQLQKAYVAGIKKAVYSGIALGFTYLVIFCAFALAFAFGAGQVRSKSMEPGDVLVTFFSVFVATISIGQAAPAFGALATARGAAPRIYEIIRRQSEIDPLAEDQGRILEGVRGEISFKNVKFNYPTRVLDETDGGTSNAFVLENFNLDVDPGTTQALVGSSGCGKSTTVRLIERFYDVEGGEVLLDGVNVRELNVRWLRSQIGYVGQMPTLFMISIRDNIALGAAMDAVHDDETGKTVLRRRDVSDDEIVEAAMKANAHDFVMRLPEKYDTLLGERGALLSGGQKQRICIARALVRNPKILLLDESTSALDAQSERIVQDALEKASEGRTTISIAHRLSTVRNANVISVIEKGTVVERGSHDALIKKQDGVYRNLVEYQNVQSQGETASSAGEDEDHCEIAAEDITKGMSVSKTVDKEVNSDDDVDVVDSGVLRRAFMLNIGEIGFILLGMVGSAIAGAAFPVMAITFSSLLDILGDEENEGDVRFWALMFVVIGGAAFIGYFLQYAMLGLSGERLTRKLRGMAFRAIIRQEIGFFDVTEHSVGRLTTKLATEATLVKGITGDSLGGIALVTSTLITGFLIAFIACWRVALVVTVIFPLMAVSEGLQIKMMSGFDSDSNTQFAKAGAVASEAVDNYDTVSAIGAQDVFIGRYNSELEGPLRNGKKTAFFGGVSFGIAEFLAQALWAISFWAGSIFVREGNCEFVDLMKAVSGLLFAGSSLGQASLVLPDFGKSKVAATNLFRLIDRTSKIDPTSGEGVGVSQKDIRGEVGVDKVKFEYPTRPEVAVLRGLSFEVECGQTLALVGESGCGKSTIVSLVERFYDARSGKITIDDKDTREYSVKELRNRISIVSQEPDLFNRTVRDNIAYGLSQENGTPVTESMIVDAAKAANADGFIRELPNGYDTEVGARGSKLSGGQRQRVAIARALVRAPRVLLLDEATSALDAVSERLVQDALDEAAKGRTTIAIAHRLSTIKDADVIAVVQRGKIVEKGTHNELLRKNGAYATLVQNQMSESP